MPVALFAGSNRFFCKRKIFENAVGIGPLLEKVIVFEEVVMAKSCVANDDGLHRHRILFQQIGNAWIGIDDHFVGETDLARPVQAFLAREQFAE